MEKSKEPSREEKEKAREKSRYVAMKNLRESNLQNLAISYFAQDKDRGYGERDNAAVEEFLYFPAINSGTKTYDFESGEGYDLMRNSLLASRQDRVRYSGQISEHEIIKTSASIIQKSLEYVKAKDIMDLLGSTVDVKEAYKEKYLIDLLKSANEEDKKIGMTLMTGYLDYAVSQGVSKSLGKKSEQIKGGLEKIIAEDKSK